MLDTKKLKQLQAAKGLTATELAFRCGVSEASIHGYLGGRRQPLLDTAVRLAEVLDTTVEELSGKPKPKKK